MDLSKVSAIQDVSPELKSVAEMLKEAKNVKLSDEYPPGDLTCEVVYSAIYAMKENPELTIEEACEIGIGEWIK